MVASPGFAPEPPVSETGALLIMQRGNKLARHPKLKRASICGSTHKLARHSFAWRVPKRRMVAREGIAPSTSLCKRDMILFHHRALKRTRKSYIANGKWRLAAGDGFAPPQSPSKGDVLRIRRPGISQELVEPEVVATSPYRIKSPVPVCCGFDSNNEIQTA